MPKKRATELERLVRQLDRDYRFAGLSTHGWRGIIQRVSARCAEIADEEKHADRAAHELREAFGISQEE